MIPDIHQQERIAAHEASRRHWEQVDRHAEGITLPPPEPLQPVKAIADEHVRRMCRAMLGARDHQDLRNILVRYGGDPLFEVKLTDEQAAMLREADKLASRLCWVRYRKRMNQKYGPVKGETRNVQEGNQGAKEVAGRTVRSQRRG